MSGVVEKQKSMFSEDEWRDLLPVEDVPIGKRVVSIPAMGFEDTVWVIARLLSIRDLFKKEGISLKKMKSVDDMPVETLQKILKIIMTNIPDVVERASGIPFSDFRRFPFPVSIPVIRAVLNVNIESFEGLEKNLQDLVGSIKSIQTSLDSATEQN